MEMKHTMRLLLTIFVVLTMALSTVTPAFAEEPPPPPPAENPDGAGSSNDQPAEVPAGSADEAPPTPPTPPTDVTDPNYVSMPNYHPGGAATSGMGAFQGEQLVNTAGNPVADGTNLAALVDDLAYACPPGQLPDFMTGGTCSASYSTAQEAADNALAGWTIWLTPYFDDNLALNINVPLTIQGNPLEQAYLGVLGGSTAITINSGNVTLRDVLARGNIYAINNTGSLRLQDVFVDSPLSWALYVSDHTGNVLLSQVNATGSSYGSYVDVTSGTGTVTVVNSVFDGTQWWNTPGDSGYGLKIIANNTVKLENVSASGNYFDGLFVQYMKGLSIKNGIFNNNYNSTHASTSHPNWGDGVGYGIFAVDYGSTPAPVLLQNVTAIGNDEHGVRFESPGAVSVFNSIFRDNDMEGLYLNFGHGSATLDGVTSEMNGFSGANIDVSGAVNINASKFDYNYGSGLLVDTLGAVTLKAIKASGNSAEGVKIYNSYTGTSQGVNVLGGYYEYNGSAGILIGSNGNVTLNGVTVTSNSEMGGYAAVEIDNCNHDGTACRGRGNVTLSNSMGSNNILFNFRIGLAIVSGGNVSANSVFANDNLKVGIIIDTEYGVGNVTLTNATANQNGWDWWESETPEMVSGIEVFSRGSISLDKVTAVNNTSGGIKLSNSAALSAKAITLKNVTSVHNFTGSGVRILSRGTVTVNHLTSLDNGDYALYIDNMFSGTTSGVSIQNTLGANLLSGNYNGLMILSNGSVSLTGVLASDNLGGWGAYIRNFIGTGTVTITNSQFNQNNSYGLTVESQGNISLSNVQANGNEDGYGAFLNNALLAGKTVTISKSSFSGNQTYGLGVAAGGNITFNNILANDNVNGDGVWAANDGFGAYNISILSSLGANMFNRNGIAGVDLITAGNIVISKATASNNTQYGFYLARPPGAISGKTFTLTCSNANYNATNLYVNNTGSTAVNVYLNGSGLTGFSIDDYNSFGTVNWIATRTNCP
jgi:hypothetical protein